MRLVRLELTRPNGHYPLKVARLPFRHSRMERLYYTPQDTLWQWLPFPCVRPPEEEERVLPNGIKKRHSRNA